MSHWEDYDLSWEEEDPENQRFVRVCGPLLQETEEAYLLRTVNYETTNDVDVWIFKSEVIELTSLRLRSIQLKIPLWLARVNCITYREED